MIKKDVYILSVDDDKEFNTLLERKFQSKGIRLKTTSTIKDFTEELRKETPSLCLIDINLEESASAGFTLLKALRKNVSLHVPIFIFSARNDEIDIVNALSIGANDYITKPLDFDFLLAKITRYLQISDIETREYSSINIPTKSEPCQLAVHFELHAVGEFNLVLRSPNFITKGTLLKADFMGQITSRKELKSLTVSHVMRNDSTGLFYITCDFDSEDTLLLQDVRRWLNSKSPSVED